MRLASIEDLFDGFAKLKVVIIGDAMIDAYTYGTVDRISPEAPVPVVRVQRKENRPGGAANVALNLQALGATPLLCSVIGKDAEGALFEHLMAHHDLSLEGIVRSRDRITTVKNRILSPSQQLLRVDTENDFLLNNLDRQLLLDRISDLIKKADVIIFEDYDKGCLDREVIKQALALAADLHLPTAVDPKLRNFNCYSGCTLFKPNLKELSAGTGMNIDPLKSAQIEVAAEQLEEIMPVEKLLVTLSNKGIYFRSKTENGHHPAHLRAIADVSGAGDTVISIAALCLALDLPLSFLAEMANLGGGIVCESPGVVPVDAARLKKEAQNSRILASQLP